VKGAIYVQVVFVFGVVLYSDPRRSGFQFNQVKEK